MGHRTPPPWTIADAGPTRKARRQPTSCLRLLFGSAVVYGVALAATSAVDAQTVVAPPPTGAASAPAAQGATPATTPALSAAAPQNATTVGEIIVTANKREQSLLSVPASVTAVSGAALVDKGIFGVQDLVKVTPGLSYVESGRSVPVYSLRGVGFFDQSIASRPTVSVYVDEAPIPFSIESKGAAFDLERVEVLKGPQGTLFGQNATGGAINYIAAKPTSTFQAGVIASYGRFDTGDVQGYVSGPLTSDLNARFALRTVHSGDWQESYTRDDSLGAQNLTEARLLFDWRPTNKLKVQLNLNGFYDGSDTQAAQFEKFKASTPARAGFVPLLASYPVAPDNDRAADFNAGEDYSSDNLFYQGNLRIDYAVSDRLTLTSLTSYSSAAIKQLVDADGTALTNLDTTLSGRFESVSEELRATGDVGRVSYIVGFNYSHDDTRQNQLISIPYSTTAFPLGGPPQPSLDALSSQLDQHFDTKAVFGNLDVHATDRITLHGGVRYTDADLHYDDCSVAPDAGAAAVFTFLDNRARTGAGLAPLAPLQAGQCVSLTPSFTTDRNFSRLDQDNVSWKVGVDYKPVRNTLLYFNVSKGYKAGSASTPAATNDLQYSPATQESVLAYEGGLKSTFLNRLLEVTAAGFYYDYRDKQFLGRVVFQPNVFGPLNVLTNVPKSEIEGGELQVTAAPLHGLTLTAASTYLFSKVDGDFVNSDILGNSVDFKGNAFPYTPKWQVVLDGEYRFPVLGDKTAILGANANYRSRTTSGFGGNNLLDIDSYWLLDLRAAIQTGDGKYRVQLYARNVTNQYYWTNVNVSVDNIRRYAGMPATYGVQVSARY